MLKIAHGSIVIVVWVSALFCGQALAETRVQILQPQLVLSCTNIEKATSGRFTKFAPVLGQLIAQCQKDNSKFQLVNLQLLQMAFASRHPPTSARNTSAGDWTFDLDNIVMPSLLKESRDNARVVALKSLDREVPSYASEMQEIKDPQDRVGRFFNNLYLVFGDPEVFEKQNRRILSNDYKITGTEYASDKVLVLTCFDFVEMLNGKPALLGVALEPIFQPCYENANKPIVMELADAKLRVAQISTTFLSTFGPYGQPVNFDRFRGVGYKNSVFLQSLYEARKMEAQRQADAERQKLAEDENRKREQARLAAAASEQKAKMDAQAAELKRWKSLTPQQQAAEQAAVAKRRADQLAADCSQMAAVRDAAIQLNHIQYANQLSTGMAMNGCN